MKHRLRDLICCPACGRYPLDLTILETEAVPSADVTAVRCSCFCSWRSQPVADARLDASVCSSCYGLEVVSGILHCGNCPRDFPIIGGVPRFNPDAQADHPEFFQKYRAAFRHLAPAKDTESFQRTHQRTKRSFGFQWLRYRVTGHEENRQHFFWRTGETPGALNGKLFFEAGCGMGRYLRVIADEPPSEVVGLDLSLAVDRAYAESRPFTFVHLVQGNILELPLRPGTFDHVYSIGALHHTPNTKEAFKSILKLVKPGGRISIWVYHVWRPPYLRGVKAIQATIRGTISDGLRGITTRLPLSLVHYLCYLAVPVGWLQIRISRLPAVLKYLLAPLLWLPCSTHPQWRIRVLDTFDWYSPRFQWKHTVAEVENWFREAGLLEISTAGFAVTVRGTVPPALSASGCFAKSRERSTGRD